MARRRPPEATVDHDLEDPPPGWLAGRVWSRRWHLEYRPPLPRYRAQAWRTVLNAGPAGPHVEDAHRVWAALDEAVRRRCWEQDANLRGEGRAPCPHHDHQPVALCPTDCPTVARLQREHDASNSHYWTPGEAG